jgi:TRAP-type C4-dicarboxylate transport system permease small subunit
VISITGRAFIFAGLKPVPGDFELVEAGTAFAVFSFLPWCHLRYGHASVEVFTARLPAQMNRAIDVVSQCLMLAIAVLIAWRHWLGTLDKYSYNETTFILQFPVWWGYAASMPGAIIFVVVTSFCLLRAIVDLIQPGPVGSAGGYH